MKGRPILAVLVLMGGCVFHRGPTTPEPARGPAADSLLRFDQSRGELVATKGPHNGMADLLHPDVVYLRAGVPAVYGRDAVSDLLAAPAPAVPSGIAWEPLGGAVSYDLLAGYTFGITARPSTGAPVHFDRYIAVWRRTRGAPWQLAAYVEVDAPPAVEASVPPSALTPKAADIPEKLRATTAKVRAADSLFADLNDRMGLGYAFSNTIAPAGVLFASPRVVVGPDATRELYAARGNGTSLSWHPVFAWVTTSEDLGFTIGEYIATLRGPSGAAVQRFGKYLTVWQRQRDGSWKFVADGGNPTPKAADR
jgi:ketosteroid isomerase-like protein